MTESSNKKLRKIEEYAGYIMEIVGDIHSCEVNDMVIDSVIVDKLPSCCDNCMFSSDCSDCYHNSDDIYCTLMREIFVSSSDFNKFDKRAEVCPLILKK